MHQPMDRSQAATVLDRPGHFSSTLPEEAERIFVGLGANLGDRQATLQRALQALAALPGTELVRASALYRSAPWQAGGPDFLNAVAELRSSLSPRALLAALQGLEQTHGRERPYPNAPRTLDLDLLLFGQRVSAAPELLLPHPRLHLRGFVLVPLCELAPGLVVPGLGPLAPWLQQAHGQAVYRHGSFGAGP
jgi:2-amino-4-hydroxy-6-hydroxymethyldihydropteridine diphosphokinase